jgi:YVTN family beta-propeller protein
MLCAQTPERPLRSVTDPGVVTTRQAITPAGVPTIFQGRVYGVAFGDSASELWVLNQTRVYRLDWKANRILDNVPLGGSAGLQGIRYDGATGRALVSGVANPSGVRIAAVKSGKLAPLADKLGTYLAGGLAVASEPNAKGRRMMVAPLVRENKLAILDAATGQLLGSAPTGIAPFAAAIDAKGTVAYVTNWGGRLPTEKDLTARTGVAADADKVVVNDWGMASTGSVTRVDLASMTATHSIAVELHPTGIVWDEPRSRLYIANGNRDSVSVIDTQRNTVMATWPIQPFDRKVTGIAPTALAIAQDGRTLFVACGGINAVVVVDTAGGALRGMIPAAWYPNTLTLSPDGRYLAIGSLLGAGSGWRDSPGKRFVHSNRGAVNVVEARRSATGELHYSRGRKQSHASAWNSRRGAETGADRSRRDSRARGRAFAH